MSEETNTNVSADGQPDVEVNKEFVEVNGRKYSKEQAAQVMQKMFSTVGRQGNELGKLRKQATVVAPSLDPKKIANSFAEGQTESAVEELTKYPAQYAAFQEQVKQDRELNDRRLDAYLARNEKVAKMFGKDVVRAVVEQELAPTLDSCETLEDQFFRIDSYFEPKLQAVDKLYGEASGYTSASGSGSRPTSKKDSQEPEEKKISFTDIAIAAQKRK